MFVKNSEMKTLRFLSLGIFMFTNTFLNAQITFTNAHSEPVYVAFAHYVAKTTGGYWMTQGWWTVNSGSSHLAYETIGPNDSIGYFAVTTLSDTEFPGGKNLLVHPDEKFTLRNADQESVQQQNPQYEWRKFRIIRMPAGTTSGTITLKK